MMNKIKIICIGNTIELPEFCIHNAELEVVAIICEKSKLDDKLYTYSLVKDIQLFLVSTKAELLEIIFRLSSEIGFAIMYSFGIILPEKILEFIDVYNIHPSLLPSYKGRHPTFWGIIENEFEFGISLHKVTKGIDEGEIISQKSVQLYYWEDHPDLMKKLIYKIPQLISDLLIFLKKGVKANLVNLPGNYYPPVTEDTYTINLKIHTPAQIFNLVKAQRQYHGAIYKKGDAEYHLKKIFFEQKPEFGGILDGTIFKYNENTYIKYKDEIGIKLVDYHKFNT